MLFLIIFFLPYPVVETRLFNFNVFKLCHLYQFNLRIEPELMTKWQIVIGRVFATGHKFSAKIYFPLITRIKIIMTAITKRM